MKKFNLNRKIFHVKTLGAARSRCNNIVINYEYNIQKNKKNKNLIFRKITKTRSILKNQNYIKKYKYLEKYIRKIYKKNKKHSQ